MYRDLIIPFRTQYINGIASFRSRHPVYVFDRLQIVIRESQCTDHLDIHHILIVKISIP